MTKEEFRRLAQSGLLFLDGATGSNLQKQGMPVGVCPELWITEHEEIMIGLQKAYLEAGTNILYAPTFTANRIKLKEFDPDRRTESQISRNLQKGCGREGAGGRRSDDDRAAAKADGPAGF
jgi:5-methyltetrahydrofolate--homocysteine methyltransferase